MRIGVLCLLAACKYAAPIAGGDDDPVADAPDPDSAITVDTPLPFTCPVGYATIPNGAPGSLYRISGAATGTSPSPGRATWDAAELDCRNDGPGIHLAIPETDAEYEALTDAASGASRWLGVTDRNTEGTWIPIIGGSPTDFVGHWFGGGAPNGNTTNNCMQISGSLSGQFALAEAMPCQGQGSPPTEQWDRGYICECDMQSVDTSTF